MPACVRSQDDALGGGQCKVVKGEGPVEIDKMVTRGYPQPGAGGYIFPDFELSFCVEYKGIA